MKKGMKKRLTNRILITLMICFVLCLGTLLAQTQRAALVGCPTTGVNVIVSAIGFGDTEFDAKWDAVDHAASACENRSGGYNSGAICGQAITSAETYGPPGSSMAWKGYAQMGCNHQ